MSKEVLTKAAVKIRILIVDGDDEMRESLAGFLEAEGYEVTTAGSHRQAVNCLTAGLYNLLITDLNLPDGDGLELLRHVRNNCPQVESLVVSSQGTIDSAVQAVRQGAFDYLARPLIDDEFRMVVQRAIQQQSLAAENIRLRRALSQRQAFENIIGEDFRMARVFELVDAVADTTTTVLMTGDSGTGKSVIARAIHARSTRSDEPFVEVTCGALPDTLLESELFGHVKGAFTGAIAAKEGRFAAADGGTIFLDEISTASPHLQVKLLRVLQEKQFEPVGSNETITVNVRVILATNRDLEAEVRAGRFREDLYYRINVVNIELPPLRDRLGDILLLAEHFLNRFCDQSGKQIRGFTPHAMELMQRYGWPGNIRELENCVERAVVLCRQQFVGPDDLSPTLLDAAAGGVRNKTGETTQTLREAMAEPEKQIIAEVLHINGGCRKATAEQLGINRTTLYKKMKRFGLL